MKGLIDYALTERQKQVVELVEKQGMSLRKAAEHLGISVSSARLHYKNVKLAAAERGYSPEHDQTKACPPTQRIKGVSTLYDDDGNVKQQWVKSENVNQRMEAIGEIMCEAIHEKVKPTRPRQRPRSGLDDTALAVYPIGDAHIGLYCWHEDSGGDWDLDEVESVLLNAFSQVLAATRRTEQALIVNLGDWFHTDTTENTTRRSKNVLDVDTRWPKVVNVGVKIMKYMITEALSRHDKVHVINEIGNHDDQSAVLMAAVLDAFYTNEPRVTIDTSPDVFHWYEFHNNLIGVHHGHTCSRPQDLYKVMAEMKRAECGRCKHRYWYTGHIHQVRKVEYGGQIIETFRAIPPADNWAHGKGYENGRDICSIILDKDYGECFRATVNLDAVRGRN